MNFRLLGKSGLRVSEAALGTMTFGDEWGWGSPKDEAQKVYETYREAGGNVAQSNRIASEVRLLTNALLEEAASLGPPHCSFIAALLGVDWL